MTARFLRLLALNTALLSMTGLGLAQAPAGQASKPADATTEKTAGEQFKNVQVLKDIKASELQPTMRFMAGSLGVACNFCHVNPWEKDERKEKATAREMIKMTKAINDANFEGKQEVTCNTCHRGSSRPVSVPQMDQVAWAKPPRPAPPAPGSMPSPDEIIAKYVQAIGGQAAADAVKTRVWKASVTQKNGMNPAQTFDAEFTQELPDKLLMSHQTQRGPAAVFTDGKTGWSKFGDNVREMNPEQAAENASTAALFATIHLGEYTAKQVFNKDTVNGHEVYVVNARTKTGREQLFFDTQSGLLMRRITFTQTPLGNAPHQTDFDDYRAVGNLKLPYSITQSELTEMEQLKITSVEDNVKVDPAKFAKPAGSAAPSGQ